MCRGVTVTTLPDPYNNNNYANTIVAIIMLLLLAANRRMGDIKTEIEIIGKS